MRSPFSRVLQWLKDIFPSFFRFGSGIRTSNYMLLRTAMLTWQFLPMWKDLFRYLSLACQLSHPMDETVEGWLEENRENYQPQQLEHVEALHRHLRDRDELRDWVLAIAPLFTREVRDLFSVAGSREHARETLRIAVDMMESRISLLLRIQASLSYPIFLIFLAGGVVMVTLWKVIPTFAALFISLGARLPWTTRLVVSLVNFWLDYSLFFLVAAILLLILFVRSEMVLRSLRKFSLRIPMLRRHLVRLERVRLLRALSILARQNRLDLESLGTISDYLTIDACKAEWEGFVAALQSGERWSRAIGGITFLTPDIAYMLGSFSLEREPAGIVRATHALSEQRSQTLTQYLLRSVEPLLILLLGVLFALVIVAMYTPMYSLIGRIT